MRGEGGGAQPRLEFASYKGSSLRFAPATLSLSQGHPDVSSIGCMENVSSTRSALIPTETVHRH